MFQGVVARKGQRVEGLFLGVPRESEDARVAASPEVVTKYCKLGIGVMVESGAGMTVVPRVVQRCFWFL